MLTVDTLKTIDVLKDLPEDKLKAIAVASAEDENKVVAAKTKEIWSKVDFDMKEVLGEDRPLDQKTYAFNKKLYSELKELRSSKNEYSKIKEEYDELKKAVSEGKGSQAQLEKLERDLQEVTTKHTALKNRYEIDIAEKDKQLKAKAQEVTTSMQNSLFENIKAKIAFKEEYSETAKNAIFENFKNSTLSKYQIDGLGTSEIKLKDVTTDMVLSDPNRENKPMALIDFATKELAADLKPIKEATPGVNSKKNPE